MTIRVDEQEVLESLAPLLEEADCRDGLANLAADPFFVA